MRAQSNVQSGSQLNEDYINVSFQGGYDAYVKFFQDNLVFPKTSYKSQVEGLMLFYFDITPEKEAIDVTFLTLLDEHIEEEIRKTVQLSRSLWKLPAKSTYRFYQPIVYSLLPFYPDVVEGDLPELPGALPDKFLQMLVFIKSRRLTPDFDLAERDTSLSKGANEDVYVKAKAQYERMQELKKPEYAHDALSEMIRFNPLEKDFLLARINLEKELGRNKYQAYDAQLLTDFVDGAEKPDSFETRGASFADDGTGDNIIDMSFNVYDTIYNGGQSRFTNDFMLYYQLPSIQYISKSSGVLLVELKSNEEGQIETQLLTSFSSPASKGLENALRVMALNWKGMQKPFHKVLPVFFGSRESVSTGMARFMPDYRLLKNDRYMRPLEISGLKMQTVYKEDMEVSEDKAVEAMGMSLLYQEYEEALSAYESWLSEGKLKKAGQALSEAIALNPFNTELIKKRMAITDKKIQAKYGSYDRKLLAFLKMDNKKP
ncbi:MAG: hypothetical protein HEP71_11730 [Roseivirga sp.]|nr:hypothetical protein [Roseivirga sp.]